MPSDGSGDTPSAQLGDGVHWGGVVLTRQEIAQVAYQAGFRGDALVDMVGIAFRESGGAAQLYVSRPSTGDWSYGLWGLNVGRNESYWPEYAAMGFTSPDELRTPQGNARAAFALYQRYGLHPWGGYKGMAGTYSTDLDAARAAVAEAEAEGLLGQDWDGPAGTAPAAAPVMPVTPGIDDVDGVVRRGSASPEDVRLQAFLDAALAQRGDIYDFDRANAFDGNNANLSDPDPRYFDCSELVQWAASRAGVEITDGSWLQYQASARAGLDMTVDEALHTPGALLFKFSSDPMQPNKPTRAHVAISLGDGVNVMEASSPTRGVNVFSALGRDWTHAGAIPGLGTTLPTAETVSLEDIPYERDSDLDGLRDRLEILIGTDMFAADTDRDGFADVDELVSFESNPLDFSSSPLGEDRPDPDWRPPLTNADDVATAPEPVRRITTPPAELPSPPPSASTVPGTEASSVVDAAAPTEPPATGAEPTPSPEQPDIGTGDDSADGTAAADTAADDVPPDGTSVDDALEPASGASDLGEPPPAPAADESDDGVGLHQIVANDPPDGHAGLGLEDIDDDSTAPAVAGTVMDGSGLDAPYLDAAELARLGERGGDPGGLLGQIADELLDD